MRYVLVVYEFGKFSSLRERFFPLTSCVCCLTRINPLFIPRLEFTLCVRSICGDQVDLSSLYSLLSRKVFVFTPYYNLQRGIFTTYIAIGVSL